MTATPPPASFGPAYSGINRRALLGVAGAGLAATLLSDRSLAHGAQTAPSDVPPFVRRGLPGSFHEALKPLEGKWNVEKRIYIAVGTKEHPAVSHAMTCTREWVGGGKHLVDVTQGSLGDSPYYRMGVLGFSTMDHRYEWATFDALNANSMLYASAPMDTPKSRIEMIGTFTDQGLLGEAYAGKSVPMRTMIDIQGPDRHAIDLVFMPRGKAEILIDRSTYTRA